jgi:hypothetical protein
LCCSLRVTPISCPLRGAPAEAGRERCAGAIVQVTRRTGHRFSGLALPEMPGQGHYRSLRGVNCCPDLKTELDNRRFWRPKAIPPARDAPPFQQVKAMGPVREGMASASSPGGPPGAPPLSRLRSFANGPLAGSSGVPSPAFSRLTSSQTGRAAACAGAAANETREKSCDAH